MKDVCIIVINLTVSKCVIKFKSFFAKELPVILIRFYFLFFRLRWVRPGIPREEDRQRRDRHQGKGGDGQQRAGHRRQDRGHD